MRFFPSVPGLSMVAGAVMVMALLAGFQPQAMSAATGDGLTGNYFTNLTFTPTLPLTPSIRIDEAINFPDIASMNLGFLTPAFFQTENISILWTGQITPLYSETYTFYTDSDDGSQLYIGNQLVVDNNFLADQDQYEASGTIKLTVGVNYDIKVLYRNHLAGGSIIVSWSSASQAKQVIPQTQLSSAVSGDTVHPSTPTNLISTAHTDATVSLQWTASTDVGGVLGYNIYRDGVNVGFVSGAVSYVDNGLAGLTLYTYTVKAVDIAGLLSDNPSNSCPVTTGAGPAVGTGDGLLGTYFPSTDFNGVSAARVDQTINFINWGTTAPIAGIGGGTNPVTIRWTGTVQPRYSEAYTFYVSALEPVKLVVDGVTLFDAPNYSIYNVHPFRESSGTTITLTALQRYTITLEEKYEGAINSTYGPGAILSWSSPSVAKQIIPQTQLYSSADLPPVVTITAPTSPPTPVVFPAGTTTVTVSAGATDPNSGDTITGWSITDGTNTFTGGAAATFSQDMTVTQGAYLFTVTATSGAPPQTGSATVQVVVLGAGSPTTTITTTATPVTTLTAIPFTVTFSAAVTGFVAGGVTVTNGTVGNWAGAGAVYTFDVTPTANGTVTVNVPAGVAFVGAAPNQAATPVSVTADQNPTVTINQAAGQRDPTYLQPVVFNVVFSAPVTGFTASDVVIGGTAPGTPIVTVTGSGATYRVTVSGITGAGTLTVSILAGSAQSVIGGLPNLASTSTDNTVTMSTPPEKKKRCGIGTGFVVLGGMLWLLMVGLWLGLRSKRV